jgi:hypothetical protein
MMTKQQIDVARNNWTKASMSLGFKLTSPYFIEFNGSKREVFAFLPEFGSPNGIIVNLTSPPEYETDIEIIEWARENKVFYSFISVESCLKYREDYFRDTLDDWLKFEQN